MVEMSQPRSQFYWSQLQFPRLVRPEMEIKSKFLTVHFKPFGPPKMVILRDFNRILDQIIGRTIGLTIRCKVKESIAQNLKPATLYILIQGPVSLIGSTSSFDLRNVRAVNY